LSEKQAKILGALLPAHQDFQPILQRLREEYNLPDGGIIDKDYADFILEQDIPWEEVRKELKNEIINVPDLWPEKLINLLKQYYAYPALLEDPGSLMGDLEGEREDFKLLLQGVMRFIKPIIEKFDEFINTTTDLLLTWLATGETADIPFDWFGTVSVIPMFDDHIIMAMAGPFSDPKEIAQQFTAEHHRIFGKDRYRISGEFLNNIDLLRMKFDGVPLKDISDEYIQGHRSQFAKDERSPQYRSQKRRLEERIKKQLQRHEETLMKLIGGR